MNYSIVIAFILSGNLSCFEPKTSCQDTQPLTHFTATGYIIYYQSSQDGQREFWFFPVCLDKKPYANDTAFFTAEFKRGISFHLPLAGNFYKNLSNNSHFFIEQFSGEDSIKTFYNPVFIEFDKPENSTSLYSTSKSDKDWSLNFSFKNKKTVLHYFISDDCHIKKVEVIQ